MSPFYGLINRSVILERSEESSPSVNGKRVGERSAKILHFIQNDNVPKTISLAYLPTLTNIKTDFVI